jgi:hypothetical protein
MAIDPQDDPAIIDEGGGSCGSGDGDSTTPEDKYKEGGHGDDTIRGGAGDDTPKGGYSDVPLII